MTTQLISGILGHNDEVIMMLRHYEHLIGKYHFRFIDQRMEALGISGPLGFYLMEIDKSHSIKQNQMIGNTPYHKSHATRMLCRLQELGLVEKSVDSDDQRGYIITITDKGHEIAMKAKSVHEEWDHLVDETLTKEEYDIMTELMKKTYLHLKSIFGEDTK